MKITMTAFLAFGLFAAAAVAQTGPADSNPELQGSASYSMPQTAIDAEIGGSVTVAIRVDETGKPERVVIISGPSWPCGNTPAEALQDLSSTLSETLMKIRFKPAIKDGNAIEANVGLKLELKNPKLVSKPAEIDPATGKTKPTQINGGLLNGKAKILAKPAYPAEAKASGESGSVAIQILVDEDGKVIRAGGVEGAPMLQFVARKAACDSVFPPTRLSGQPVKVSGLITYNFVP